MELLSTINLLALVLLPFVVPKIWKACWIFLLRPWMITRRFKKQGISGPKYRFVYGNLKEIKKMKKEAKDWVLDPNSNDIFPRVVPHYHNWLSQYGETFIYWNGTKPTLFISDPELGKQILSRKLGFAVIAKTRPEVFILFGKGLPFIEGDDWARHRRILNPAFSMDRLKVMTKRMVDCTLRMLEEWRQQRSGEEVMMRMEINKDFHRLISDIIAATAFGSSYEEGIELFKSQTELEEYFVTSLTSVFIPGTQYLPTPTNLQLWKLDKKVKDSIKRIIDARLKSNSNNYGDDLLGIMLKAATSKESEKTMSMDEVIEECKTFYISGQGSSSILLTWTTLLLSLHQDWQEKLREEVFNECGKDTVPDSDTFSKLKLMNMVLMESLRLYGPVIKMVREATKDMKIGHLDIPKGTSIIVPFLKMHSDKAIWGEDAKQFNPLRFENGVSQAANQPNALLPFSVGPRTCIAQNFAMMEAKTVLTMILQRFRISLSPEYKHTPVDYFNLHPQYGLPILEKKKKVHDLIKRASSRLDPLSPFDSFRRYTKNDESFLLHLSVYLEPGRGDRLSSSLKQHIRKLLKVPILDSSSIKWVQPNTLVRFRGMIQDMLGNEFYAGAYKVPGQNQWTECSSMELKNRFLDLTGQKQGETCRVDEAGLNGSPSLS
ncbi:BnaA06g32070D [Brassica napus]|uniref:BnaA06g32070D protein n=1 Tax=Brassica napus TaxID=3708 RepID=A0A078FKN8_BRANA|nr:BnaA06g32070D [Brassica napus]